MNMQYAKADTARRLFAFFFDALLAYFFSFLPFIGGIIGFLYMLLRDGITDNGSLGKKLFGLKVVMCGGGRITYQESIRRNIIFAIPIIITIIPFVGQIIGLIVAIVIYAIELLTAVNSTTGQRYGDQWADTMVVDKP